MNKEFYIYLDAQDRTNKYRGYSYCYPSLEDLVLNNDLMNKLWLDVVYKMYQHYEFISFRVKVIKYE